MKALVRLWLILQLVASTTVLSQAQPSPPLPKTEMPDCETDMVCFTSDKCKGDVGNELRRATKVLKECPAVLKIRAYSSKHWLVQLQSYNTLVKSITLQVNRNPFFSCTNDGSNVVAKYEDKKINLESSNKSPLLCDFNVKGEYDILLVDLQHVKELKLSTDVDSAVATAAFTEPFVTPTCDPSNIKSGVTGKYGIDGANTIVGVDGKSRNVKCPDDYTIEFMQSSKYIQVDSIICEKKQNDADNYEYVIRKNGRVIDQLDQTFNARCAIQTCTQCHDIPRVKSGKSLNISNTNAPCKELTCDEGQLMYEGNEGTVQCELLNDKHSWVFNGTTIDSTTEVDCKVTQSCDSDKLVTMCARGPEDSRCIVSENNLPYCSNDRLHIDGKRGDVTCDEDNGEYRLNGSKLPDEAKLNCGETAASVAAAAAKCTADNEKDEFAAWSTSLYCLLVILLLLLAADIFLFFRNRYENGRKLVKMQYAADYVGTGPGSQHSTKVIKRGTLIRDKAPTGREKKGPPANGGGPPNAPSDAAAAAAAAAGAAGAGVLPGDAPPAANNNNNLNERAPGQPDYSKTGGEKPFRIPADEIKFLGPLHLKTRFHGEQIHDFQGVTDDPRIEDIFFDPELNEAVAIGEGVEMWEDGGEASISDRSIFFPDPKDEKKKDKKKDKKDKKKDSVKPGKSTPLEGVEYDDDPDRTGCGTDLEDESEDEGSTAESFETDDGGTADEDEGDLDESIKKDEGGLVARLLRCIKSCLCSCFPTRRPSGSKASSAPEDVV